MHTLSLLAQCVKPEQNQNAKANNQEWNRKNNVNIVKKTGSCHMLVVEH